MNTQEVQNEKQSDKNEEEFNVNATEETAEGASIEPEPEKHTIGQVAGIIIIISVLALGGIYLWGNQYYSKKATNVDTPQINSTTETDPVVKNLETQGTSDEVSSIEKDLGTTDLGNIDEDLSNIDSVFTQ